MPSNPQQTHKVVIRRVIPARREAVFAAWTDPHGIREWMCPGDVVYAEATLDVRVGGAFRILMKGQQDHHHTGTYQVVEPPSKLVFTWTSEDDQPTLVTIEISPHAQGSELVLTHERFLSADVAKRYEGGWGTIVEKLAGYLGKRTAKTA